MHVHFEVSEFLNKLNEWHGHNSDGSDGSAWCLFGMLFIDPEGVPGGFRIAQSRGVIIGKKFHFLVPGYKFNGDLGIIRGDGVVPDYDTNLSNNAMNDLETLYGFRLTRNEPVQFLLGIFDRSSNEIVSGEGNFLILKFKMEFGAERFYNAIDVILRNIDDNHRDYKSLMHSVDVSLNRNFLSEIILNIKRRIFKDPLSVLEVFK